MVDASLGGKTGFDLAEGKNLVGSFHAPQLVLADHDVLSTLPEVEFRAGLAEVVKHGVIADPELFALCAPGLAAVRDRLPEILRRAVSVKTRIIESDPYEVAERASLNFGHTVGHAIELVSSFCVRHGEAVAMGMVAEAKLAERLGIARKGLAGQISGALSALALPIHKPRELLRSEVIRAMRADKKKAAGVVRFALPVEIGRVQVNVEVKDLELTFEEEE
jgi:3-dehydroquinate synthetase